MYFENFHELMHMGGHGFYVWTAYAITLLVLCTLVWIPLQRKKSVTRLLKARQRRQV